MFEHSPFWKSQIDHNHIGRIKMYKIKNYNCVKCWRIVVTAKVYIKKVIRLWWSKCGDTEGTEVDGSNPGISMLCPWARHFIRIASVDSATKWLPGGDSLVKGV